MSSTGTMWQDVCDGFTMGQMYVIFFCIWSMQACEFNNDNGTGGYLFYSYNILFCTVFALYFFGDCIACAATVQKGV